MIKIRESNVLKRGTMYNFKIEWEKEDIDFMSNLLKEINDNKIYKKTKVSDFNSMCQRNSILYNFLEDNKNLIKEHYLTNLF